MALSSQQLQLIHDNPNLSGAALARFLGVTKMSTSRARGKSLWTYRGFGVPFLAEHRSQDGMYWKVWYKEKNLANGLFSYAIENVDRLIYCLENNNGKLPAPFGEAILKDLEFIK